MLLRTREAAAATLWRRRATGVRLGARIEGGHGAAAGEGTGAVEGAGDSTRPGLAGLAHARAGDHGSHYVTCSGGGLPTPTSDARAKCKWAPGARNNDRHGAPLSRA